jgi:dienelactone hydrolase
LIDAGFVLGSPASSSAGGAFAALEFAGLRPAATPVNRMEKGRGLMLRLIRRTDAGRAAGALCATALAIAVSASAALAAPHATAPRAFDQYARAYVAKYAASIPNGYGANCLGPAGNPAPGTAQWQLRDAVNQFCATQRLEDEYANPAFGLSFWTQAPGMYADQNIAMLLNPTHPHASLGQLVPGGTTADPFRTLARWTAAGRGRVTPISFPANDGATLNGYIFEPPTRGRPRYSHRVIGPPYPGVVITTGSIQGYQQMYFWAAEGLAEAGYEVMTYDVQGQGNSDTLPSSSNCTASSCEGVPFQQNYNFYQGSEDALNYFLSTPKHPYSSPAVASTSYNPAYGALNPKRVGIAGHSLGAGAVSTDGQCDPRVKAIVAWDNLATTTGTCRQNIPAGLPATAPAEPSLATPALGINSEYFLNPEPMTAPPDPQSKAAAYQQLVKAGTNSMQVGLRSSMHLEYSYVPFILPASHYGERVAFYYTLAWFDYYLRHMASGYKRLIAKAFDNSSDVHSIGGGSYDPSAAAADPTDPAAGNVPTLIKRLPVANRLSFYYDSEYTLTAPGRKHRAVTCLDMRADCPAVMPEYP